MPNPGITCSFLAAAAAADRGGVEALLSPTTLPFAGSEQMSPSPWTDKGDGGLVALVVKSLGVESFDLVVLGLVAIPRRPAEGGVVAIEARWVQDPAGEVGCALVSG